MEVSTTGYQWGAYMQYIGTYQILHQEGQPIHTPPNTTLVAPPVVPVGQEAIWSGKDWALVDIPGFVKSVEPAQPTQEPTDGQ